MVLLKLQGICLPLAMSGLALLACSEPVEYPDISLELSADRIVDGDTLVLPDVEALLAGDLLRLRLNVRNMADSELTLASYEMRVAPFNVPGCPDPYCLAELYELDPPVVVPRGETQAVRWSYEIPSVLEDFPGKYVVYAAIPLPGVKLMTSNSFHVVSAAELRTP